METQPTLAHAFNPAEWGVADPSSDGLHDPDAFFGIPPKARKANAKSAYAFRFSAESYIAEAGKFGVVLWTITSQTALPFAMFSQRWNHFLTLIKWRYPEFSALRVFEVHPGTTVSTLGTAELVGLSHGLHVHMLVDKFYSHQRVQAIARQAKLGHVFVSAKRRNDGEPHSPESAVNYLCKYLTKTFKQNIPALCGKRLWAAINYDGCKVKNVETLSLWNVIHARLYPSGGGESFPKRVERVNLAAAAYSAHLAGETAPKIAKYLGFEVYDYIAKLRPNPNPPPDSRDFETYGPAGWPGALQHFQRLRAESHSRTAQLREAAAANLAQRLKNPTAALPSRKPKIRKPNAKQKKPPSPQRSQGGESSERCGPQA